MILARIALGPEMCRVIFQVRICMRQSVISEFRARADACVSCRVIGRDDVASLFIHCSSAQSLFGVVSWV